MVNCVETIERFCLTEPLATYDPYDIWKTRLGFLVKDFYNHHRCAALPAAAALTLFDAFVNNRSRRFYRRQEYPIVRAMAALALFNLYEADPRDCYLDFAQRHLAWLAEHSSTGYSGKCWGLQFNYAVDRGLVYDLNTPLSTMSPYALEAFVRCDQVTGTRRHAGVVESIFAFFDRDLQVMEEDHDSMATSYAPLRDRIVVNASSYTMYAFALCLDYLTSQAKSAVLDRIRKLCNFVLHNQREDGSWLYSPQGHSFIDCFHSCIVIKNLEKTSRLVPLPKVKAAVTEGYSYLKRVFLDPRIGLYKRFSLQNKASLVKVDLYDNAEMLNLALLLGENQEAARLAQAIEAIFCVGDDIYSQLDIFGNRRNKNTLRWAVMPYLYALSSQYKITRN
ncbi:MAG: hypothetical protein C4555_06265 [Dehalococcoidia bacterium]|nr:MAG: hypothetical protein C4555_06265 [Dehalococcoidia bacterium]